MKGSTFLILLVIVSCVLAKLQHLLKQNEQQTPVANENKNAATVDDLYQLYYYSCKENQECTNIYFSGSVGVNNIDSFRAMVHSVKLDNIPVARGVLSNWTPESQSADALPATTIDLLAYELRAKFPQRNLCDYNKVLKFNAHTQTWFCQCRDNKLCSSSGSSSVDSFAAAIYIGDVLVFLAFFVMLVKYIQEQCFLLPEFKRQGRALELTHVITALY